MHEIQEKIIGLLKDQGSISLRYREIGRKIGEKYPQTVKHHIGVLLSKNLIQEGNGFLSLTEQEETESFIQLPFFGLANCGPATLLAEDNIQGYFRLSRKIFPRKSPKGFYLLRASGNSMNKADIKGKNIDDGDFVVIDSQDTTPKNNDYVVSVIDDCANIKRYRYFPDSQQKALVSESTDEYFPIVLHESDSVFVMGKVIDVIKQIS